MFSFHGCPQQKWPIASAASVLTHFNQSPHRSYGCYTFKKQVCLHAYRTKTFINVCGCSPIWSFGSFFLINRADVTREMRDITGSMIFFCWYLIWSIICPVTYVHKRVINHRITRVVCRYVMLLSVCHGKWISFACVCCKSRDWTVNKKLKQRWVECLDSAAHNQVCFVKQMIRTLVNYGITILLCKLHQIHWRNKHKSKTVAIIQTKLFCFCYS